MREKFFTWATHIFQIEKHAITLVYFIMQKFPWDICRLPRDVKKGKKTKLTFSKTSIT